MKFGTLGLGATLLAAVSFGGSVAAQPQPRGVTQQVLVVSGEVTDVDRVGRMVTIKTGSTIQEPIYAGPDMAIFDQLNRGDIVTIRYFDAVIVSVTPGARMAPLRDTTAEAQQQVGRPDALVIQQVTIVVTVDAADHATGMVTYHGVDNRRVQRLVQPSLIEGLKPGDIVTVRQARAQAVAIQKQ